MTEYDDQLLRVIAGLEELDFGGAWVTECLEYLREKGFVKGYDPVSITESGKEYLREQGHI